MSADYTALNIWWCAALSMHFRQHLRSPLTPGRRQQHDHVQKKLMSQKNSGSHKYYFMNMNSAHGDVTPPVSQSSMQQVYSQSYSVASVSCSTSALFSITYWRVYLSTFGWCVYKCCLSLWEDFRRDTNVDSSSKNYVPVNFNNRFCKDIGCSHHLHGEIT